MKSTSKTIMLIFLNFTLISFVILGSRVTSHPIKTKHSDGNIDSPDEQRFANGTVIGKYIYKDKEGNPVHVKYYANDTSYGVELKSLKLLHNDLSQDKSNMSYQVNEAPFKSPTDSIIANTLRNDKDLLDLLNTKKVPGSDRQPEYEIYTQNDLKPEKCNNERVRVYYDKKQRRIRNVLDPHEVLRFCKQF